VESLRSACEVYYHKACCGTGVDSSAVAICYRIRDAICARFLRSIKAWKDAILRAACSCLEQQGSYYRDTSGNLVPLFKNVRSSFTK
jgi:hypothetical protein